MTDAASNSLICIKCGAYGSAGDPRCSGCEGPLVPIRGRSGDELRGRVLADKYELVERLGSGGFGAVYRAKHTMLGRDVAVKLLNLDLAQHPDALRRFYTEAQNTSRLSHPNNIKIFDFGHTEDGMLFLVMELVDGVQLSRLARPFPIPRALYLVRQIAAALGEAHDLGIVHRDLKPDNVMISRVDGQDFVRVLDYGIAKIENSDTGITSVGTFIGTPAYTSPEQIGGGAVDRRCDVYTLGLILYELVVGEPPFVGTEPIAIIYQHRNVEPVPPCERAAMPDDLNRLILECLSKSPDARPPTMADVRRRIDGILAREYPRTSPVFENASTTVEQPVLNSTSPPTIDPVWTQSNPQATTDGAGRSTMAHLRGSRSLLATAAATVAITVAVAVALAVALRTERAAPGPAAPPVPADGVAAPVELAPDPPAVPAVAATAMAAASATPAAAEHEPIDEGSATPEPAVAAPAVPVDDSAVTEPSSRRVPREGVAADDAPPAGPVPDESDRRDVLRRRLTQDDAGAEPAAESPDELRRRQLEERLRRRE